MSTRINRLKHIEIMNLHLTSLNNAVMSGNDSFESKALLDLIKSTKEYDTLHRTTLIGKPKEEDLTIQDVMTQNLES
jgi:hypothetical protein